LAANGELGQARRAVPYDSTRRASRSGAALALLLVAAGCGHRASGEECERIVSRIAELELERQPGAHRQSPAERKAEVEATKRSLRDSTLKDCVGRRVTDRAMRCVERARTSQEIVDECFD
jgi:hypothetical protein